MRPYVNVPSRRMCSVAFVSLRLRYAQLPTHLWLQGLLFAAHKYIFSIYLLLNICYLMIVAYES